MPKQDSAPEPARPRRSKAALAVCLAGLAFFTWADLASKDWAMDRLSSPVETRSREDACVPNEDGHVFMQRRPKPPIVLIDGYLEFRYAENCGAAFGMLDRGAAWVRLLLFVPAATAAVLGLLWLFATGYGGKLFAWCVPLIASGALGNLVDRLRLGYVVDFIRFHLQDRWAYPTFNVADITIFVGVVLMLLEGFFFAPRQETQGEAAGSGSPEKSAS
jgi:signal peptidase II